MLAFSALHEILAAEVAVIVVLLAVCVCFGRKGGKREGGCKEAERKSPKKILTV